MFDQFDVGWILGKTFQVFVWWCLGPMCLVVLLFNGCSPPAPRDTELKAIQRGHFDFEGSRCRVFETIETTADSYSVLQRFSVCDPPLPGMLPGSKPAVTHKETNTP